MASASLMLSLAQLSTTDTMRGRVMSVYNLAFRAGIPLGALALGRIIPIVGIAAALSGAGLMLVAVSAYFLLIRRQHPSSGADSEQRRAAEGESSLRATEAVGESSR
jgi:predicted MFS family arabinose efflux permease